MTDAGKKRIDYVCLIYCLAYLHGMCMTFIENVFLIDFFENWGRSCMYSHQNGMINGVGNAYRMIITSICFLCYGLFRLYIPVIKKKMPSNFLCGSSRSTYSWPPKYIKNGIDDNKRADLNSIRFHSSVILNFIVWIFCDLLSLFGSNRRNVDANGTVAARGEKQVAGHQDEGKTLIHLYWRSDTNCRCHPTCY